MMLLLLVQPSKGRKKKHSLFRVFFFLQEREVLRLQQDIKQQVDQKMTNQKRTYFLQEQLKSIKKELGLEKDDKEAILNKFRDRRKSIKVSRFWKENGGGAQTVPETRAGAGTG